MNLSEAQRKVISSVVLDADRSIADIGKETGLAVHTVRYAIDTLQSRGILTPIAFINSAAIGMSEDCVYFSYRSATHEERRRLILLSGGECGL